MTGNVLRIGPIALAGLVTCFSCKAQTTNDSVIKTIINETTNAGVIMTSKFSVSEKNQKELLAIARQSIDYYLKNGKEKTFETMETGLLTPAAVFVTLTQKGQLRGCIGTLEPRAPLFQTVASFAVAAAVHDSRFNPLTTNELPLTHIEISVLSPMDRVKSGDEIKQNIHGVVVKQGSRSGLFLPQVWEHFSTKEDFMDELCRQKAHLPANAWKDPKTELLVFTVFAFEDPK